MTKPRLGKVRALFYVFQQVMTGREMRVHQNFDTPSYGKICFLTEALRNTYNGKLLALYLRNYG